MSLHLNFRLNAKFIGTIARNAYSLLLIFLKYIILTLINVVILFDNKSNLITTHLCWHRSSCLPAESCVEDTHTWSGLVTCAVIGPGWSRDLNTGLWLVQTNEGRAGRCGSSLRCQPGHTGQAAGAGDTGEPTENRKYCPWSRICSWSFITTRLFWN